MELPIMEGDKDRAKPIGVAGAQLVHEEGAKNRDSLQVVVEEEVVEEVIKGVDEQVTHLARVQMNGHGNP